MSDLHGKMRVIDNIIYMPDEEFEPDYRGIGQVYFDCMLKNKDLVAQIDGITGKKDTFGDLLQRCINTAIAMRQKGVEYGDVVSLCTNNHLNSCVPQIASMFLGAKVATLDPCLSVDAASYLLGQVPPKIIFVQADSVDLIENVLNVIKSDAYIVVFGFNKKYLSFDEFSKTVDSWAAFEPVTVKSMNDIAFIMFSSGTSGLPKGICHTHYSILYASLEHYPSSEEFLVFASDSPYWNVFMIGLSYSIRKGVTRLVYSSYDLNKPWTIFKHKITHLFVNVTELVTLTNSKRPVGVDTTSLLIVLTAGSVVHSDQIDHARSVFPDSIVLSVYGQTEIFPNITTYDLLNPKHMEAIIQKPGSCGTAQVGMSYKVVDPNTEKLLGPNQPGEIRVKTKMQLSGYYNMDSKDVWDADGWVKTGDYGYYDEDYFFYVVDRVKEMFKYRYWHIVPAVVEKKMLKHSMISKAVVIGIPHKVDGSHPMAVVELKPLGLKITESELKNNLNDLLEEREKLRGGVRIVKKIPLTPTGKVNRYKLKQLAIRGKL